MSKGHWSPAWPPLRIAPVCLVRRVGVFAYVEVCIGLFSRNESLAPCDSVMDVLNLWKDDPEEVLFDLGFGSDEPDLSGRIPARFINHQSHARGINIQVLLEAQKNRLDIENPDVSSESCPAT